VVSKLEILAVNYIILMEGCAWIAGVVHVVDTLFVHELISHPGNQPGTTHPGEMILKATITRLLLI